MKTITIISAIILALTTVKAESNEPCRGTFVPAAIETTKVIFELPTYDEYVHTIVINSFSSGVTVEEGNILDEATFKKIRAMKIKAIKSNYKFDYRIATKTEMAKETVDSGFIFQESYLNDLVSETNSKFEKYVAFTIKDAATSTEYTLVDPSPQSSANCIIKNGQYKFSELIELIQK